MYPLNNPSTPTLALALLLSFLLLSSSTISLASALPHPQPRPLHLAAQVSKRGNPHYKIVFWESAVTTVQHSQDDNQGGGHGCLKPATPWITWDVNDMCVDVFSDPACVTKIGTLGSNGGACAHGVKNLNQMAPEPFLNIGSYRANVVG